MTPSDDPRPKPAEDSGAERLPRVDCTADTAGRLELAVSLPDADKPRLVLRLRPRRGGEPATEEQTVELDLAPIPGTSGRRRAVIEPGSPVLDEGRWDVFLLDGPDAPRRRVAAGITDVRALVAHRPDDAAGPVAVRIPYTTKQGNLAIRAWVRPVHAEAGAIQVSGTSATVRAVLYGARLEPGATAVARRRGGGEEQELPVTVQGGGFSFVVDYPELVRSGRSATWDLHVRPATGARTARIGRLFDDVADRKEVFAYPSADIDGVSVRPYYTLDNDLSVEVAPSGEEGAPDGAGDPPGADGGVSGPAERS